MEPIHKKQRKKRNVKIIFPSIITSLAMICGFIGIIWAFDNRVYHACILVMIASLLDGIDGKVARLTNTASEFGIQYDSMADLIAFGLAPSIIYYKYFIYQKNLDLIFALLPVMFMLCGAIRLARFNITASIFGKTAFTGLPIPAAAVALSLLPALAYYVPKKQLFVDLGIAQWFLYENLFPVSVGFIVIFGLSMISSLRFDTFETFWFRKFKKKQVNWIVFAAFHSLILIHFVVYMTAVALYYTLMMYGRVLYFKFRPGRSQPVPEPVVEDQLNEPE